MTAAWTAVPMLAGAHTGGPLDADGCHADHRTGSYHCHRGEAAGYTFPNKAAMQEAVRTGVFPEKSVDAEGFFQKLWPFGKSYEQAESSETDPATSSSPADGGASPSAGGAAATPEQLEAAKRLKVLQGLYEMGLITKEEYETRRQVILDQL
ncbi:MAG: SHOCT domain-containing protein [Candidatus Binatia bacterium]